MTHVVDAKVIQGLGDLNLLLGSKESIGELLTLTEGTLDDLEPRDVAQEVGDTLTMAVGISRGLRDWVLTGLDGSEFFVGDRAYYEPHIVS